MQTILFCESLKKNCNIKLAKREKKLKLASPGSGPALGVKIHSGHAQPHQAGEHRLLHVGELLESHVLDDRGQLVVIPDHDPSLQPVIVVLGVLQYTTLQ